MAFAKVFLAIVLVQVLHLLGLGGAGVLCGARLKVVSLGFGPVVRRGRIRGVEVVLRLVPVNGYVQLWRREDEGAPEGTPFFDELSVLRRTVTHLAGALLVFAAGAAATGAVPWRAAVDGIVDLFRGALAPTSTGADLIAEAVKAAREQAFAGLFGLVAAKIAAWNLLPFPSLNGGAIVMDLLVPRGERGEGARRTAAILGLVVALAMFVAWVVALVSFLRR